MNKTNIEWCDYTWNPVTGCLHGCPYCYAKRFAERGLGEYGRYAKGQRFTPNFHANRLEEPLRIKKPSRIFVCSMGDLFGNWVTSGWINDVLSVANECPQHTFVFLTKKPSRLKDYTFGDNCWLGTSIENQEAANTRVPLLLQANAPIRFLSIEPLLGPIDLEAVLVDCGMALFGSPLRWHHKPYLETRPYPAINWVIIGAQTGPGAKPPKPEWIATLTAQCCGSGVPVFMKNNLLPSLKRVGDLPLLMQQYPKEARP